MRVLWVPSHTVWQAVVSNLQKKLITPILCTADLSGQCLGSLACRAREPGEGCARWKYQLKQKLATVRLRLRARCRQAQARLPVCGVCSIYLFEAACAASPRFKLLHQSAGFIRCFFLQVQHVLRCAQFCLYSAVGWPQHQHIVPCWVNAKDERGGCLRFSPAPLFLTLFWVVVVRRLYLECFGYHQDALGWHRPRRTGGS